ncbi:MAG: dual specificity protein phosphatase family protein [Pirellulales bacterium]|nr:dual specificity protein phosphatase family protein [Pirellulales bacterium]
MREILPQKLWLGNLRDATDIHQLMELGIVAIVDLAYEEQPPQFPRSMAYCRFPILDGQQSSLQMLLLAIECLVALLKKDIPTFVYCSAGMSRSPAIVAAALSLLYGGALDDNLRKVISGHPHDISPQLWQEVKDACRIVAMQ